MGGCAAWVLIAAQLFWLNADSAPIRVLSEHFDHRLFLPMIATPGGQEVLNPAGPFQMGCDSGNPAESCMRDEHPLHTVTLDDYYIDRYEVTNGGYGACVVAGVCTVPLFSDSETRPSYYANPVYADFPVIYITWHPARDFCAWPGSGRRLRRNGRRRRGDSDTRQYPWGNSAPDCTLANFNDRERAGLCVGDTDRVGAHPAGQSPFGVMDMAGNVWEWVSDWYASDYYSTAPASNPPGPATGILRVLRGGSWYVSSDSHSVRAAYRYSNYAVVWYSHFGFRCVRAQ